MENQIYLSSLFRQVIPSAMIGGKALFGTGMRLPLVARISGLCEHLNCQKVVTEYESKFSMGTILFYQFDSKLDSETTKQ
ncbi:MAG: hypothetical protein AAFV71_25870 [Cyanobacteria bacterium J06633_8]